MRALEDQVKPILAPLLRLEERRVQPHEQAALVAWVALKAIVAEYDIGSQRISTHEERQRLRQKQLPPLAGWRIWVGYYQRESANGIWSNMALPVQARIKSTKPHALRMNSQALIFVVGPIFFMLFRCPFKPVFDTFSFGEAETKSRMIWPRSAHSFKFPLPAIGDRDADRAAGAFMHYDQLSLKNLIEAERRTE